MTYTNAYLAYATGTGANVETDAVYASDTQRTQGVQSGTAKSAIANKAWRQSSVVAATFGQFCADYGGSNVNDDGSIPTLEGQFKAALAAYLKSANIFLLAIPATDYYVATTGSDTTGNGSSGSPWATIAHAFGYISQFYSASAVTIHVANGTYVTPAHTNTAYFSQSNISSWVIIGGGAATCLFDATATGASGFFASGTSVSISGIGVAAYNQCFGASTGGIMQLNNVNINGASANVGAVSAFYGGFIMIGNLGATSSFGISGNYGSAIFNASPGNIAFGYEDSNTATTLTITFSGTVNCSLVAYASSGGAMQFYYGASTRRVVWAGTTPVTSSYRWLANSAGGLVFNGYGLTWIPGGATAGIASSPGWAVP